MNEPMKKTKKKTISLFSKMKNQNRKVRQAMYIIYISHLQNGKVFNLTHDRVEETTKRQGHKDLKHTHASNEKGVKVNIHPYPDEQH
jgi:hypothetical protein